MNNFGSYFWPELPDGISVLFKIIIFLGILCFVNTLRPTRNRRHFADDIFKCIFVNENVWISINISLKFVPRHAGVPINNIPTLVHAERFDCNIGSENGLLPGSTKLLPEPMLTHHERYSVTFTWKQFHAMYLNFQLQIQR